MGFWNKIIEMLLTIENIFIFLQDVSPMIGKNFSFKAITENCGNKYTTILHNSPNEKTLKNSAFKQI